MADQPRIRRPRGHDALSVADHEIAEAVGVVLLAEDASARLTPTGNVKRPRGVH